MKNKLSIVRLKIVEDYNISISSEKVYGIEQAEEIFDRLIGGSTVEKLALLCLDQKFKPLSAAIVSIGTKDHVEFCIDEILKISLLCNSVSVIICHNHPSGNLTISELDIIQTKKVGKACSLVGIKLIDSLIIGNNGKAISIRSEIRSRSY